MAKTSYPVTADLTALLTAAGLTVDATQTANAVLAGIREFQKRAGRHFLAGKDVENVAVGASGVETRYFTPPEVVDGVLDFRADLATASTPTVTYQPEGQTADVLTVNTEYRLLPVNASSLGEPYTGIEFVSSWWPPHTWALGRAMLVAGKWGYSTAIPEDAWMAMLHAGLLWLLDTHVVSLQGLTTLSGSSWSHEGHSESGGGSSSAASVAARVAGWRTNVAATAKRYRKLGF